MNRMKGSISMKSKALRVVTLLFANLCIVVSAAYLILYVLYLCLPNFPRLADQNYFLFKYGYLIVPLLCLASSILLQVVSCKKKRPPKAVSPDVSADDDAFRDAPRAPYDDEVPYRIDEKGEVVYLDTNYDE